MITDPSLVLPALICFGTGVFLVAIAIVRTSIWFLDERDRRSLSDFRARLIVQDARQRAAEWHRQQAGQRPLPFPQDRSHD